MRGLPWILAFVPLAAVASDRVPKGKSSPDAAVRRAIDEASCTGEYADDLLALSNEARELERRPEDNYVYCVRNTAVYECLSYSSEGKIERRHITVQAHGTGFAYKVQNGESFLLTNEHVASWPLVTDEDHPVDDVPSGCKKIDEQLRLVRDESDDYAPGQIPVQRVVADPLLDAAVLKTRRQLNVMPYRVGRSALLRAGNIVQVRGYPLGVMEATNVGKVVTPYDPDRENGWNHIDFVIDALLTKGNSGSPVFAVSCRTGSLELVGIYHAGYKGSPALNDVVGIDQLRELMETFRKSKPPPSEEVSLGATTHADILAALRRPDVLPFFTVGDRVARARATADDHVVYDIFGSEFPRDDSVEISLNETPDASGGSLKALSVHEEGQGPRESEPARLDAEAQDFAVSLFQLTRRELLLTLAYRSAAAAGDHSRDAFRRARDLADQIDSHKTRATELLQNAATIAGRIPLTKVLTGPPAPEGRETLISSPQAPEPAPPSPADGVSGALGPTGAP